MHNINVYRAVKRQGKINLYGEIVFSQQDFDKQFVGNKCKVVSTIGIKLTHKWGMDQESSASIRVRVSQCRTVSI